MAKLQNHEGKPATALYWSELLDEYEQAARDYGSELGTHEDSVRMDELRAEITNRVNRTELRFRGALAILEGIPL